MQLQLARLFLHWRCCLTFSGTLSTLGSAMLNGVQQEELLRVFLGLDALMTASLSLSFSLTWPSWWWWTPLVSSQIPVRFLTWKLWISVPPAWPWPGKSMIMSHLQSIPTRYKLWARQTPSISQSRRLMLSSLHSAQAPCTTSRCILSLMTVPRAFQASSKFTPVSPLMVLLAFLSAGCVSDARQTLFSLSRDAQFSVWAHGDSYHLQDFRSYNGDHWFDPAHPPSIAWHAFLVLSLLMFTHLWHGWHWPHFMDEEFQAERDAVGRYPTS